VRIAALPLIALVRLYRLLVSPLLPAETCKFHPSCSAYALEALRRHGPVRGSVLAAWRVLRCHPWSHGGVDHVADQKFFRALSPARDLRRGSQ
jgi:putative membrane protein insertion efficiency factor